MRSEQGRAGRASAASRDVVSGVVPSVQHLELRPRRQTRDRTRSRGPRASDYEQQLRGCGRRTGETMKFSAQLDVNVVAHETADEVVVLLDLEAPDLAVDTDRAPATFQVVLDRSGSMAAMLPAAVEALERLVARLDVRDNFGVVVFDDEAEVAVPAGPVDDKDRIVAQLRSIRVGGMTDLGAGLLRGLQEVRRVATTQDAAGATLLLVSDGHTNCRHHRPGPTGVGSGAGSHHRSRHLHPGSRAGVRRVAAGVDGPRWSRQPRLRRRCRPGGGGHRSRGDGVALQDRAGCQPDCAVQRGRPDAPRLQRPARAPARAGRRDARDRGSLRR